MWENQVGRGRPFWNHFFPRAKALFSDVLGDVSETDWYRAVNRIEPSLIRTESDQATYNLHILLRFELELALVSKSLSVTDLPGAWNQRMQKYLGIVPSDDADGVLQDIHWSGGAIGYFPTYTLGNLYAAQMFEAANAALPDLAAGFSAGSFHPLLTWLRQNVHGHGKTYSARELIRKISGRPLSAVPLLKHLNGIAADVYGV